MIKLSKRLQAICDLVPNGSKIIDIGTDHGYVPIYLNKFKNSTCLATDISKESLRKAKINAEKLKANIKFKLTDGLTDIKLTDEIIIISGMGTRNILKILNDDIKNDLILSTNNDVDLLIEKLEKQNYKIHKKIVIQEHKNYTILYLRQSKNIV